MPLWVSLTFNSLWVPNWPPYPLFHRLSPINDYLHIPPLSTQLFHVQHCNSCTSCVLSVTSVLSAGCFLLHTLCSPAVTLPDTPRTPPATVVLDAVFLLLLHYVVEWVT